MKIGRYEVLGEIGRGGASRVLRARAPDGREVAIKTLLAPKDPEQRARFEREAKVQGQLGEAGGFVPVLDRGESESGPFIVLPFMGGGSLRQRLTRGKLGVEETIALGRTLARALGEAHDRGIIHRDLKPENILFTGDGRPLIADLGLARQLLAAGSLTQSGVIGGTLGYMPAEQIDGLRAAGPPADVFALGAVLQECLTGRKTFEAAGVLSYSLELRRGSSPLASVCPEAPAWLGVALGRALAADPAARFQDGRAFAAALDGPAPAPRAGKTVAAGVLGLFLAAGGIFALTRPGDAPPTPVEPPPPVIRVKILEPHTNAFASKVLSIHAATVGLRPRSAAVKLEVPGVATDETAAVIAADGTTLDATIPVPPAEAEARVVVRVVTADGSATAVSRTVFVTQAPVERLPPRLRIAGFARVPGADHVGIYRWRLPADAGDIEMMWVPPGPFTCGSSTVPEPMDQGFWIARFETTWALYEKSPEVKANALSRHPPFFDDLKENTEHPVVNVSLEECSRFCAWAGLELPSPEQWEKAARGTDGRTYPWGNEWGSKPRANFADRSCPGELGHRADSTEVDIRDHSVDDGFPFTARVGSFPLGVSPYGVHDMAGNVSELCRDGSLRGGSWLQSKEKLKTTSTLFARNARGVDVGFRTVYALPAR
jgi:hypothetical protein